jgi:hypothetical protein
MTINAGTGIVARGLLGLPGIALIVGLVSVAAIAQNAPPPGGPSAGSSDGTGPPETSKSPGERQTAL